MTAGREVQAMEAHPAQYPPSRGLERFREAIAGDRVLRACLGIAVVAPALATAIGSHVGPAEIAPVALIAAAVLAMVLYAPGSSAARREIVAGAAAIAIAAAGSPIDLLRSSAGQLVCAISVAVMLGATARMARQALCLVAFPIVFAAVLRRDALAIAPAVHGSLAIAGLAVGVLVGALTDPVPAIVAGELAAVVLVVHHVHGDPSSFRPAIVVVVAAVVVHGFVAWVSRGPRFAAAPLVGGLLLLLDPPGSLWLALAAAAVMFVASAVAALRWSRAALARSARATYRGAPECHVPRVDRAWDFPVRIDVG